MGTTARVIPYLSLLLLSCIRADAQAAAPTGYEPLIAAGAIAAEYKDAAAAEARGSTLESKQIVLDDKRTQKALTLLRDWLNDPRRPQNAPPFSGDSTGLRALSRLLSLEQYVLLALGHVGAAIDSARDGLRMSFAVKPGSMLSWLVGDAIDSLMTRVLSRHLDQLALRDCDRLQRLAGDRLQAPDAAAAALNLERLNALKNLDAQIDADKRAGVHEAIDQVFGRAEVDLTLPYWERVAQPAPMQGLPADLVKNIDPLIAHTLDEATRQKALARLLFCHAVIRRYKWDHDLLPGGLDPLNLGDMAIDPYTGKPFEYKVKSGAYTLRSAGPVKRDDSGALSGTDRQPFSLEPGV